MLRIRRVGSNLSPRTTIKSLNHVVSVHSPSVVCFIEIDRIVVGGRPYEFEKCTTLWVSTRWSLESTQHVAPYLIRSAGRSMCLLTITPKYGCLYECSGRWHRRRQFPTKDRRRQAHASLVEPNGKVRNITIMSNILRLKFSQNFRTTIENFIGGFWLASAQVTLQLTQGCFSRFSQSSANVPV